MMILDNTQLHARMLPIVALYCINHSIVNFNIIVQLAFDHIAVIFSPVAQLGSSVSNFTSSLFVSKTQQETNRRLSQQDKRLDRMEKSLNRLFHAVVGETPRPSANPKIEAGPTQLQRLATGLGHLYGKIEELSTTLNERFTGQDDKTLSIEFELRGIKSELEVFKSSLQVSDEAQLEQLAKILFLVSQGNDDRKRQISHCELLFSQILKRMTSIDSRQMCLADILSACKQILTALHVFNANSDASLQIVKIALSDEAKVMNGVVSKLISSDTCNAVLRQAFLRDLRCNETFLPILKFFGVPLDTEVGHEGIAELGDAQNMASYYTSAVKNGAFKNFEFFRSISVLFRSLHKFEYDVIDVSNPFNGDVPLQLVDASDDLHYGKRTVFDILDQKGLQPEGTTLDVYIGGSKQFDLTNLSFTEERTCELEGHSCTKNYFWEPCSVLVLTSDHGLELFSVSDCEINISEGSSIILMQFTAEEFSEEDFDDISLDGGGAAASGEGLTTPGKKSLYSPSPKKKTKGTLQPQESHK